MKITYDKIADAMYITLSRGRVAKTLEISSDFIVDKDRKGGVLGLEVLNASQHLGTRKISNREQPFITIGNQTFPLPITA